jgi:hypothetical protein
MIILILKLLEIFQYVFISFFISLFITNFLNNHLYPLLLNNSDKINTRLYVNITIYLFILSSVYYFLARYIKRIPFVLKFLEKYTGYISSMKNENARGTELGIAFIFFNNQNNFKNLIDIFFNK